MNKEIPVSQTIETFTSPAISDWQMLAVRLARLHDQAVESANSEPNSSETFKLITLEKQVAAAVVHEALTIGRELLAAGSGT